MCVLCCVVFKVWVSKCLSVCVWKSEDNLGELVLSTMWVLGVTFKSLELVARSFIRWAISLDSRWQTLSVVIESVVYHAKSGTWDKPPQKLLPYFSYMCVCVCICVCVCMGVQVPAPGGQRRESESLELKWHLVARLLAWTLVTKLRSSARAADAPHCPAVPRAPPQRLWGSDILECQL